MTTRLIRWFLIPPFRGMLHAAQWAAYSAFRAWMDREDSAPPLPPFTDEDREWLRKQHNLTRSPR